MPYISKDDKILVTEDLFLTDNGWLPIGEISDKDWNSHDHIKRGNLKAGTILTFSYFYWNIEADSDLGLNFTGASCEFLASEFAKMVDNNWLRIEN